MVEKAIYFSPTGGVKKVAEILCNDLIDFTLKEPEIVLKNEDLSNIKNPDGYKKIVEFFKTNSGKYTKSELINEHSISQYKLNNIII